MQICTEKKLCLDSATFSNLTGKSKMAKLFNTLKFNKDNVVRSKKFNIVTKLIFSAAIC